jgi:hypothetical protein
MCAEQRHLELPVLLQFQATTFTRVVAGHRHRLRYGEPELFASVVDTTPLRRGSVPRKIGGKVASRMDVRAIDQKRHHDHPQDNGYERERPRERSR